MVMDQVLLGASGIENLQYLNLYFKLPEMEKLSPLHLINSLLELHGSCRRECKGLRGADLGQCLWNRSSSSKINTQVTKVAQMRKQDMEVHKSLTIPNTCQIMYNFCSKILLITFTLRSMVIVSMREWIYNHLPPMRALKLNILLVVNLEQAMGKASLEF